MRNNIDRLHRLHYGAGEWIYRAHINNSDLRLEGEPNSRRAHWYIHKKAITAQLSNIDCDQNLFFPFVYFIFNCVFIF